MNKKENAEPDTDSLFGGLIRAVIIFAVCCYLVNLGVCYLAVSYTHLPFHPVHTQQM